MKDDDNSTAKLILPNQRNEAIITYTNDDFVVGRNNFRLYSLESVNNVNILVSLSLTPPFNPQTMAIIGDSFSAFTGYIPDGYDSWYINPGNAVSKVEDMWWYKFCKETGCRIGDRNNSFSGTCICKTTRPGQENVSFVDRVSLIKDADLVIIEGGTNDNNIGVPMGNYQYSDWTPSDLLNFRPALAYVIDYLQKHLVGSKIIFMLNNGLSIEINSSVGTICDHYGVDILTLNNITKEEGHPNPLGHTQIKDQLLKFIR